MCPAFPHDSQVCPTVLCSFKLSERLIDGRVELLPLLAVGGFGQFLAMCPTILQLWHSRVSSSGRSTRCPIREWMSFTIGATRSPGGRTWRVTSGVGDGR